MPEQKKIVWIVSTAFVFFVTVLYSDGLGQEECTVAVAIGSATVDGRPLLWKNRDTKNRDNEIVFLSGPDYDFVAVVNTGETSKVWMGLNTAGFAIMNSESLDLEGNGVDGEGYFMKTALGTCRTVDDFENLLKATSQPGRTTKANFGVIDATGAGVIFETGNHAWVKFDAADYSIAPFGYIVRTNFALTGNGRGHGHARYRRAQTLFREAARESRLSYRWILRTAARDLVNDEVDPYPLPFEGQQGAAVHGFVKTQNSINRHRTASCAVFHGVKNGEDPALSTMWCILGEPICGVALPFWPRAHAVPPEVDGLARAPLNDAIQALEMVVYADTAQPRFLSTAALVNTPNEGLLPRLLSIEDWVVSTTEARLAQWRQLLPSSAAIREFEFDMAAQVLLKITAP